MGDALAYSPAHWCHAELDSWCAAHCPQPKTGRLVARQPSTSHTWACYDGDALRRLESIAFDSDTPGRAPALCGRASSEYVRDFPVHWWDRALSPLWTFALRSWPAHAATFTPLAGAAADIAAADEELAAPQDEEFEGLEDDVVDDVKGHTDLLDDELHAPQEEDPGLTTS